MIVIRINYSHFELPEQREWNKRAILLSFRQSLIYGYEKLRFDKMKLNDPNSSNRYFTNRDPRVQFSELHDPSRLIH